MEKKSTPGRTASDRDTSSRAVDRIVTAQAAEIRFRYLSARLARHHGKDFYDVHVLKGAELTDARVGIDDGKVLSTHPMQHRHTAKAKAARHEQEEQPATKG